MLNLRKLSQVAISILLLACVSPVTSFAATEKFQVNLIATIDDGPAMTNVEWLVTRSGEEVRRVRRHSAHINVPPGSYKVVARLTSAEKTVVRTRKFLVRDDIRVVVPMDH